MRGYVVCGDGASGRWSGALGLAAAWAAAGTAGRALAVTAAAWCVAVTAVWLPMTPAAIATGACVLMMMAAALVDVAEHRLPNVLVMAASVPVLVALVVALAVSPSGIVDPATGAAWFGGPLLLTHLVSPAGMGFGDVKAGTVLGAALGLINPQFAVLGLFLALTVSAAWALARRRAAVALGPGLVAGALLSLLIARWAGIEADPWR